MSSYTTHKSSHREWHSAWGSARTLRRRRSSRGAPVHGLEVRVTTRDELTLMLRLAGFAVESVYGGFDSESFIAESDHLTVLARRGGPPPA